MSCRTVARATNPADGPRTAGQPTAAPSGERQEPTPTPRRQEAQVTVQANKAKVMRLVEEAFNRGDLSVVHEAYAPDHHVAWLPESPAYGAGREALGAWVLASRRLAPDHRADVESLIGEGDEVVALVRSTGTFWGDAQRLRAGGLSVRWTSMLWTRFEAGRAVESVVLPDRFGMLRQLGVLQAVEYESTQPVVPYL